MSNNILYNRFFEIFRKKINQAPEPEVRPDLWAAIEQELPPNDTPRRKLIMLPFVFLGLGLVGIASFIGIYVNHEKTEPVKVSYNLGIDTENNRNQVQTIQASLTDIDSKSLPHSLKQTLPKEEAIQRSNFTGIPSNTKTEIVQRPNTLSSPKSDPSWSSPQQTKFEDSEIQKSRLSEIVVTNLELEERNDRELPNIDGVTADPVPSLMFFPKSNAGDDDIETFEYQGMTLELEEGFQKTKLNLAIGAFSLFNNISPLLDDQVLINNLVSDGSSLTNQFGLEILALGSLRISDKIDLIGGLGFQYSRQKLKLNISEKEKMSFTLVPIGNNLFELQPNYIDKEENIDRSFYRLVSQVGFNYHFITGTVINHSISPILELGYDLSSKTLLPSVRLNYTLKRHENTVAWSPFVTIPLKEVHYDFFKTRTYHAGIQLKF